MADSTIQVLEGMLGNYGEVEDVQMNGLAATYAPTPLPVVTSFQGITDTLLAHKWKILGGVAFLGAAIFGWRFIKARRARALATQAGVAGYGRSRRKGRKSRKSRR